MNETRTINWTAGSGQKIEIEMVAQYGLNLQSRRKTSGLMSISIDTKVDGESLGGMAHLETIDHPVVAAKIGNGRQAVGLSQENLDRYNAAKAELEALIAPNNAACEKHEAELDALSDEQRRIERKMAEGQDC